MYGVLIHRGNQISEVTDAHYKQYVQNSEQKTPNVYKTELIQTQIGEVV